MDRTRLSDGERETLAELARDAHASDEDLEELLESADCLEDVFGELIDAADYVPEPFDPTGTTVELDPTDYPY